jgi:hypothetical protein
LAPANDRTIRQDRSSIFPFPMGAQSSMFLSSEWRSKETLLVSDDDHPVNSRDSPNLAAGLTLFAVVLIIRAVETLLSCQPYSITGCLNALVNTQEGVIMDLIINDNDNMV